MSPEHFGRLALALPEATECHHMQHPDFRVRDKIFAGLDNEGVRGFVKLTREQQELVVAAEPDVFTPAAGAWGVRGWTHVTFAPLDEATARSVLSMAWRNVAPKRLLKTVGDLA